MQCVYAYVLVLCVCVCVNKRERERDGLSHTNLLQRCCEEYM